VARVLPAASDLPIEVKIGQLIMAGVAGTSVTDDAGRVIGDLQIGNVVVMGRNVESPRQVLALTHGLQELAADGIGIPLLIATDQEGGQVQRLSTAAGFLPMPDAATVGTAKRPEAVRQYARAVGEELRAVGVNVAFAPVLDVNDNPRNPVIGSRGRSFAATAGQVESAAIPFLLGLRDAGVFATGKHFPGHGSTAKDSHVALPVVAKTLADLTSVELPPFQAAIDHGIELMLPAHVAYPALDPSGHPASVSSPILTGLLRRDMGFTGVVVTDDFEMQGIRERFTVGEAAVRAIAAGADIVLCVRLRPPDALVEIRDSLLTAVRDGRISTGRIDESVDRVLALKRRLSALSQGDGLDRVGGEEHRKALAALLH
jgi:beta-N-acetylhexosaminidase